MYFYCPSVIHHERDAHQDGMMTRGHGMVATLDAVENVSRGRDPSLGHKTHKTGELDSVS